MTRSINDEDNQLVSFNSFILKALLNTTVNILGESPGDASFSSSYVRQLLNIRPWLFIN